MGLASLGLDIGIFCDSLYSVLLLGVFLGLDFSGLALSQPQRGSRDVPTVSKFGSTSGDPGAKNGSMKARISSCAHLLILLDCLSFVCNGF
jgi:hypothetical protein